MPLFMDRHDVPGASAEDAAAAHVSDLDVSGKHGVQFISYWFDESVGGVFCFAQAPAEQNLRAVHEESHGLVPNEIISVSEDDVVRFLGSVQDPKDASEVTNPARTVAFTDLVDSTALLSEYGEDRYISLIADHDSIVRRALARHHGREIKHTGDGIMAVFDQVPAALDWALTVMDGFASRHDEPRISVRIGMAAGVPVDRNDDIYGKTVVLASRLCSSAGAGCTVVSAEVHSAAADLSFGFTGPTDRVLKGFPSPVRAFELTSASGQADPAPPSRASWWQRLVGRAR
jgi:class 3 adenylate cyclase